MSRTTRGVGAVAALLLVALVAVVGVVVGPGAAVARAGGRGVAVGGRGSPEASVRLVLVTDRQVGAHRVRTTVRVVVRSAVRPGKARVRLNPYGKKSKTGRSVHKTVKLRHKHGTRWVRTVRFTTRARGRVVTRVAVAGQAQRRVLREPRRATTTITGARDLVAAEGSVARGTVQVRPGLGRKVKVQERVGSSWVTRSVVRARRRGGRTPLVLDRPSASVTGTDVRVLAPRTPLARRAVSRVIHVSWGGASTPAPRDPAPPATDPVPPATDPVPATGDVCGTDMFGYAIGCGSILVQNINQTKWVYDVRCGKTRTCRAASSPAEAEVFGDALPSEGDPVTSSYLAPNLLTPPRSSYESENTYGVPMTGMVDLLIKSRKDLAKNETALEEVYTDPSGRAEAADKLSRADELVKPLDWGRLYTAEGESGEPAQGGFSQLWAEHLATTVTHDGDIDYAFFSKDSNAHSCDGSVAPECRIKTPENSADTYMDQNVPLSGQHWRCAEVVAEAGPLPSANTFLAVWRISHAHWGTLMNVDYNYISTGVAALPDGTYIGVMDLCEKVDNSHH